MSFLPIEEQLAVIRPGLEEILTEEALREKLTRSIATGKPLRVKQGFDPTAPDIHLGHTVGLRILRRFQDLGHQIVLIIGDYTALVGDPSGRNETRPALARDAILANAATYQEQFFRVLDRERTEVRFNGEWFADFDFNAMLQLCSRFTVARMLERDDFEKRHRAGVPICVHEFLYPLMQGYDSVMIDADVELGATEQTFNLLAARSIQRDYGKEPQVAVTYPVLPGVDGTRRMSKSLGNYIGVAEAPEEMYGKAMSIPDELLDTWATQVTDWRGAELEEALRGIAAGNDPMGWKSRLAARIVELFHGGDAADEARAHFDRVVRRKEEPEEIPETQLAAWDAKLALTRVLKETDLAPSTSEARRLIKGGGVTVDGEKIADPLAELDGAPGSVYQIRVGKRRFLRVEIGEAG